ncbi:MAG TPA: TonB-dependent receptor [Longimicrobiales bacterium]
MLAPLIALLTVGSLLQDPGAGTVRGRVYSLDTGAPLAFALVEVRDGSTVWRAVTDASGSYAIVGVRAGRRWLRAQHIDHAPLEVEVLVPAGGEVVLDVGIELRPVKLPAVVAGGGRGERERDTAFAAPPELSAAAVRALEAAPGVAELGLVEAARGLPGREPADPTDVLYVRGGGADLKLVLLDGAPVYAPFHLGGLLDAFEPNVLRSAKMYVGGAPARYDGGLSYVLDLATREGRRDGIHSTGALDLVSARGTVEGPIGGRASYLVGGRAIHGAGAFGVREDPFPFAYEEGLARIDLDVGREGVLGVTGFWNEERVRIDTTASGRAARWGNAAASVRYRGPLFGQRAELTAAVGRFRARLPVGSALPLLVDGESDRIRLAADFSRPFGDVELRYGASFDRLELEYEAWRRLVKADSAFFETGARGDNVGGYVEALVPVGSRVRVRGGLRADVFGLDPTLRLAPRLSATWLLSDRAALTFAAGHYRQHVRAPEGMLAASPGRMRVPPLSVASASHVVLGLQQDLGGGVRLGLEGFFKRFSGLLSAGDEQTEGPSGLLYGVQASMAPAASVPAGPDDPTRTERANASGLDLWVRRSTGDVTGWLGYSLAWVWSTQGGSPTSTVFSGRHLLSLGLTGVLGSLGRFHVRLGYGAGLPYTAIPEPDASSVSTFAGATMEDVSRRLALEPATFSAAALTYPAPGEPYLRLDAEFSRTWRARLWGAEREVTPYLKVLNTLDRRDALFYYYDPQADPEPRALAALPVLPVLGVEWKF